MAQRVLDYLSAPYDVPLSGIVNPIITAINNLYALVAQTGSSSGGSTIPVGAYLGPFYQYFTPTLTPNVGVSTPFTFAADGSVIKGTCNTGDDNIALQQYMDACSASVGFGGFCFMSPRSDGQPWLTSKPLYYKHDTHYHGGNGFYRPTTTFMGSQFTAYNGATAYAVGAKVSSGGLNYFCIQANTGQLVTNTAYWKIAPNGYILEPDARDATYLATENSSTGEVEYRTDRYKGSNWTVTNFRTHGDRENLAGWNVDLALNTSMQVGGILVNQATKTIRTKSNLLSDDSWVAVSNCLITNMSGEGFRARGRGEGMYSNMQIFACSTYGFVHNEYDANATNFSIGDSGMRGFVQLREFSRDNRYWGIKVWYSGRLNSKGYSITTQVMEAWRLSIGEPTLPDDPTTLLYAYSSKSGAQIDVLTQFEKYQRELAYIAGITNIATGTAAWTSGGSDGGSPYTATGGTNSGATVAATAVYGFVGNPTNNQTVVLNGVTVTFKTAGVGTSQVTIGGSAAVTAANFSALIAANPTKYLCTAAAPVGTDVTLTSRLQGAAGNSIDCSSATANVTVTDVAAGTAITKLRGGRFLPAILPLATSGTVHFAAGVWSVDANPLAPNGLAWTAAFEGNNFYIEGADCEFWGCMGQDAYREDVICIGKRNTFTGCRSTQGPEQPRRIYWACDAIVNRKSSFTDSGGYNSWNKCTIYDPTDPATNYGFAQDGNATNLDLDIKMPQVFVGGNYHKLSGTLTNCYMRFNNGTAGAYIAMP